MTNDDHIDPQIIANHNAREAETDAALAGLPRERRYPHDMSQAQRLEDYRVIVDRLEHDSTVAENDELAYHLSRQQDELAAAIREHDPRGRTVRVILEDEARRRRSRAATASSRRRRRTIVHWVDIARDAIAELEDTGADCGTVRHALAMIVDAVSHDDAPDVELYWTSEDGSGQMPMGLYASDEAATDAIPAATAELLAECATDQERANIRAGRWTTTTEAN